MDWLKKLPGIGPIVTWLMGTHAWQAYERLDQVKWTRLAAAMTFISFVALFPLLTLAAAITAATLSPSRQKTVQDKIADQFPGLSQQLDLSSLVHNAGTVGVIAGALLLFTGIGWVGQMRDCLRVVWELPEREQNPIVAKVKDAGVLVGLGGALLLTLAASTLASAAVGWLSRQMGLAEHGWGSLLLRIAAFAVAVLADFLVLLYVLTLLPGAEPPRRRLLVAALIGAVGFELLKLLLSGYIQGVAAKSMYGAFGVPVALLLWINFTSKLVLYCAAWTATQSEEASAEEAETEEAKTEEAEAKEGEAKEAKANEAETEEAETEEAETEEAEAKGGKGKGEEGEVRGGSDGGSGPAAANGG